MKRPLAVSGCSMLAVSLILYNANFRESVAVLCTAAALFCFFLFFKRARKDKTVLCALLAAAVFTASLISAKSDFYKKSQLAGNTVELETVVCEVSQKASGGSVCILKTITADGKKDSFKLRFVSGEGKVFRVGDKVKGALALRLSDFGSSQLEHDLADGIYFTAYGTAENTLCRTGGVNYFYRCFGALKTLFTNTVKEYLPGENSAVINAVTVGDRSEISEYISKLFSYSGTSHLLVVSGLHLTVWAMGLARIMQKSGKLRRFKTAAGILGVFFYAALTGFGLSVIRAGVMMIILLLAGSFKRGADSLNSLGAAVSLILAVNPMSARSISLWLSVLSTAGIVICSKELFGALRGCSLFKPFSDKPFVKQICETVSVTVPAAAFTLPVYIIVFKMLPTASLVSNFLMVGPALAMMVLAAAGMLFHFLRLRFIAQGAYFAAGALSRFLCFIAERVGMHKLSAVSLYHPIYKYFLLVSGVLLFLVLILRRFGKNFIKPVSAVLSCVFVLTLGYTSLRDYSSVTADFISCGSDIIISLNSEGENLLIMNKADYYTVKNILTERNCKEIDALALYSDDISSASEMRKSIPVKNIFYRADTVSASVCGGAKNVTSVSLNGELEAELTGYPEYAVLKIRGETVLVLFPTALENPFKNNEQYDIIIVNGECCNFTDEELSSHSARVLKINGGERLSVCWENT